MGEVEASELREGLSDALDRAAFKGERVYVLRHGKRVAALVPAEDLKALEALEDSGDLAAARRAVRAAAEAGEKSIPWDEARKRLA